MDKLCCKKITKPTTLINSNSKLYHHDFIDINENKWYNDIEIYTLFTLEYQNSDDEDFPSLTENFIQYSTPNCNIVTL